MADPGGRTGRKRPEGSCGASRQGGTDKKPVFNAHESWPGQSRGWGPRGRSPSTKKLVLRKRFGLVAVVHSENPKHTHNWRKLVGIESVTVLEPTRVLVVNGNQMFCAIIAESIARDFPEFVIAAECSVEGARKRLETERFRLVVTDIYLSDLPPNGIARLVAEKQPKAVLLVITPHACFAHKEEAEQIQ